MTDRSNLKLSLCKESPSRRYKPSRYNVIINFDSHYILYNTLTGAIAILDDSNIPNKYFRAQDEIFTIPENHTEIEGNLIENGFFVPAELDELQFYLYGENLMRFTNEELNVVLMPTRACNFKCPYCFEVPENSKMDKTDVKTILGFIENLLKEKRFKKFILNWYGGEPLLALDIIRDVMTRILEITRKLDLELEFGITTNGFFLTESVAAELQKFLIKCAQITIHPGAEAHNRLRPTKDGKPTYERVKQAIITATKFFDQVIVRLHIESEGINYVLNFLEEEKDWLSHPKLKLEPAYVFDNYSEFCFLNHVEDKKRVSVSTSEYLQATELVAEFNRKKYGVKLDPQSQLENLLTFTLAPRFGYCRALHNYSYVIGPRGLLYKCISAVDSGDEVGKVNENGIVINHNYLTWVNYSPSRENYCQHCKFLPFCAGGCPNLRRKIKNNFNLKKMCDYIVERVFVTLSTIYKLYTNKEVNYGSFEKSQ